MRFLKSGTSMLLKENTSEIQNAIKEVFAASEEIQLKGCLVDFNYTEDDSSDLRAMGGRGIPQQKGAGIQIAVQFSDEITRRFYYPENECPTMESFLDNLNTDFAMAQIINSKENKSLKIFFYDLTANTISFKVGRAEKRVTKEGLDKCWNVNTLTFNVDEFRLIKSAAEKEIVEPVYRGVTEKGFFSEPPVLPSKISVIGINKAKFLEESEVIQVSQTNSGQ